MEKYTSWSELSNPSSKLVTFLEQTCEYSGNMKVKVSMNDVLLDECKLKVMGILFCKGSNLERANEFFDCILEGQDNVLFSKNKHLKHVFYTLLDTATETLFENEARFMNRVQHQTLADGSYK